MPTQTDETALGPTHLPDQETNKSDFVQMDFADPLALQMATALFEMRGVQTGEEWELELAPGNLEAVLTVPEWGRNGYDAWTATAKNDMFGEIVLTKSDVAATGGAPEPGTMSATGATLIGVSLMIRRLRKGR